jgi:hypothetical protein
VIKICLGRPRYDDLPDATVFQLVELERFRDQPWYERAVATLRARGPTTDESAASIVREAKQVQQRQDEEAEQKEIASILDGAPPDLPPSTISPEPQRFAGDTAWAEQGPFVEAVRQLLNLHAKSIARFVGVVSPEELDTVIAFLTKVAEAGMKAKAA